MRQQQNFSLHPHNRVNCYKIEVKCTLWNLTVIRHHNEWHYQLSFKKEKKKRSEMKARSDICTFYHERTFWCKQNENLKNIQKVPSSKKCYRNFLLKWCILKVNATIFYYHFSFKWIHNHQTTPYKYSKLIKCTLLERGNWPYLYTRLSAHQKSLRRQKQ